MWPIVTNNVSEIGRPASAKFSNFIEVFNTLWLFLWDDESIDTCGTSVGLGYEHTCILNDSNKIQCVGDDNYGQVTNIPTGDYISISSGWCQENRNLKNS